MGINVGKLNDRLNSENEIASWIFIVLPHTDALHEEQHVVLSAVLGTCWGINW